MGPVSIRTCVFHKEKTWFDNGPAEPLLTFRPGSLGSLLLRYDLGRGGLSGTVCAGLSSHG